LTNRLMVGRELSMSSDEPVPALAAGVSSAFLSSAVEAGEEVPSVCVVGLLSSVAFDAGADCCCAGGGVAGGCSCACTDSSIGLSSWMSPQRGVFRTGASLEDSAGGGDFGCLAAEGAEGSSDSGDSCVKAEGTRRRSPAQKQIQRSLMKAIALL
jgi:hypothetical protein